VWKNPAEATPSILQVEFGPWGENLPGDGLMYCGPTAMVMGLYYLSANGFTQLAPTTYNGQEDPAATNLELVIGGLCQSSSIGGTSGKSVLSGISAFLSACGISPEQVQYTGSDHPDFDWITTQIAPNVQGSPSTIVLANFGVQWFSRPSPNGTTFTHNGGHFVVPLLMNPAQPDCLEVNNPAPTTFESGTRWEVGNPETVTISTLPSGWTLPGLPLKSQCYSQVLTDKLGGDQVAIIGGGQAWAIDASAQPSSPGYQPSIWTLTAPQAISTNGGTLSVLAPLAGAGGISFSGAGMLQLTNTNQLSGANSVSDGVFASTLTSGAPFGTGAMALGGGGILQFSPSDSATVASALASRTLSAFAETSTIDARPFSSRCVSFVMPQDPPAFRALPAPHRPRASDSRPRGTCERPPRPTVSNRRATTTRFRPPRPRLLESAAPGAASFRCR